MNDYAFDYESIDDVRRQIAKLCRAGVYDGMDVYGMQKDLVEKFIEYAEDSLSNDNIRDASIALANAVQQINAFYTWSKEMIPADVEL